jgi:hypothetical protein
MTDLRSLLEEAAGPLGDRPAPEFTDALLSRGRSARRRRSAERWGVGAGLLAVVALSAFLILPTGRPAAPMQFVTYNGTQPPGFVIDRVPDHWFVQARDSGSLVLAPVGLKGVSKNANEFDGKIVVDLEAVRPVWLISAGNSPTVDINGRQAVIFANDGDDHSHTLFIKEKPRRVTGLDCSKETRERYRDVKDDPNQYPCGTAVRDTYLAIQIDGTLGWTTEQMIELAKGIHVTKDAVVMPIG